MAATTKGDDEGVSRFGYNIGYSADGLTLLVHS